MKRISIFLLALWTVLIAGAGILPAGAAQYYTIAEIREQTQSGWHQTYEAHGRTITVDIDIEVPEVEALPILRVKRADGLTAHDPALAHPTDPRNEALFLVADSPDFAIADSTAGSSASPLLGTGDTQAENNDLTAAQARDYAEALAALYEPQTGPLTWRLRGQLATGRYYEHDNGTGTTFLDRPLSAHGMYSLLYEQELHGIGVVTGGPSNFVNGPEAHDKGYPRGQMKLNIGSPEHFTFSFTPAIEQGVVQEDVPLASFELAKKEFEAWIADGRVREVYGVRLGYMIFDDPEDLGESFLAVPVWRLLCHYEDTAGFPTYEYEPMMKQYMVEVEQMRHLVVLAQSGELLDFINDRGKDRHTAREVLTWEEVR